MATMSPLTSLITVLFLLLIAVATVSWLTLTARERAARAQAAREARPEHEARRDVSNDAVRGAKAPRKHAPVDSGLVPPGEAGVRVRPRRVGSEDPFERFLDPERRRRNDGDS